MAEIISFNTHPTTRAREVRPVPHDISALAYKSIYEAKYGTFYVGRVGYTHSAKDISRGHVPYTLGGNQKMLSPHTINEEMDQIKELVDVNKVFALSEVKEFGNVLTLHLSDSSLLYIGTDTGVIGGGYLSRGESPEVSDKMLAFIMNYTALSIEDEGFQKAIREYIILKFGEELNRTFSEICNMK